MQQFLSTSLCVLFASALASASPVQESAGLKKIHRTFAQADANQDGFLDPAEAKRATIPSGDFLAQDHDGDRRLSNDEFLVYYRGLLQSAKVDVAADIDREAKRITDERRKAAERAARAQARREAAARAESAGEVNVEKRFDRAEGAVRDAAGRGELSRAEAKQRKNQLVVRARRALDRDAQPGQLAPSVSDKLKRVEAALASKVAAGQMTRAEADQRMKHLRERAEAVSGRSRKVAERVVREAETKGEAVDVRKRFERAQGAIGQSSGRGELSRDEAKQQKDKLIERARNAQRDLSPTERQKLDAQLKQLDEALAAGKLNAAQHAQRKQALIERAQRAGRVGADAPLTDEELVRQRVLRERAAKDKARREAAEKKRLDELEGSADDILRDAGIGAKNAEAREKKHAERLKREKEKEEAEARERERQAKSRREQEKARKRAEAAEAERKREKRRKEREGDGTGNRPGNNPW